MSRYDLDFDDPEDEGENHSRDDLDDPAREDPLEDDLDDSEDDDSSTDTLLCPSCRGDVHEDTQKCPHCGDWITPIHAESRWKRTAFLAAALIAIIGLLLATLM